MLKAQKSLLANIQKKLSKILKDFFSTMKFNFQKAMELQKA